MPTPSPSATGLPYGPVLLHNIRDVRPGPEGLLLGRLPPAVQPAVEATTRERAGRGTGCELRFRLRSGEAVIRLRTAAMDDRPENGLVEVWHGAFPADFSRSPVPVGPQWRELRIRLPEHGQLPDLAAGSGWSPHLVRVRLPYDRVVELGAISGDIAAPEAGDAPARRLCCYGSSITHGSAAMLPSTTGMWQAADALGMDLLNLGFPGSARLEPAIARMIAADPAWTVATAELGINVIGEWEPPVFAAKVEAFLAELAGAGRPVLVTGLYRSRAGLEQPERVRRYQAIVAEACARHGLASVDGDSFLDQWQQLSSDLVHPGPAGMAAIGRRWAEAIRALGSAGI